MLMEYMVLFVQFAFLMSDLSRLTCHFSSATYRLSETEFGFAFAIGAVAASNSKASITLIQRLCLFRVCDNIVDATNLHDYVRELELHFVVKLFVTYNSSFVNIAHSSAAERW